MHMTIYKKIRKTLFVVEGNVRVSLRCVTAGLVSIKPNEKPCSVGIGVVNAFPVNKIRERRLVFDR